MDILSDKVIVELVKLIPAFLWFLLVVVLVILFYKPIRHELVPNLTGLKVMGVTLSFVQDSLNSAIDLAEKTYKGKFDVQISEEDKKQVLNRVKKHLEIFQDARFLWIDDEPTNNRNEEKMFRQLNVTIEAAKSSEDAFALLKKNNYDVILSDISRGEESTAGLDFLKEYAKQKDRAPLIFYVGMPDPSKGVPAQAFGITHRPDELLHLTLDALERKKY